MKRLFVLLFALALVTGCGPVGGTTPRFPGIDEIRRRAEANPNDLSAQRWLAEGELTMEGGDTARARAAIDHALSLAPEDPDLVFMSAIENNLHGRLAAALDDVLHAIAAARASSDPHARFVAEAAASAISDYDGSVPGFAEHVRTAIGPIVAEPGNIGPAARALLGGLMIELAYRQGDVRRVSEVAGMLGCSTDFRVAGPFGPRALLDFDRALPPEEPGPLADRYDLGPARRTRETRTIETRGCALHLGNGPVGGAGTTYAETDVSVPSAGRYLLRLETPNAVEIFVDDASVARVDRRVELTPRTTWHALDLTAGAHRIMLKVASRHPNPLVIMSLTSADGSPASSGGSASTFDPTMFEIVRPYDRLLGAAVHVARSDYVMAREVLHPATEGDDASVTMLVLASTVASADPLRGQQLAADDARRFLDVAHERDATAWYPTYQLLVLDALAGRVEQALPALSTAGATYPEVPLFPVTIAQIMQRQGWAEQADHVIDALLERNPDSCAALQGRLASLVQRGHEGEAGQLADTVVTRCDARSDARLTHLVRQRNWADAASELSRIAALEPNTARFQILDTELTLARARGDHAAVQRLLGELEHLMPQSLDVVMMQADLALSRGDRDGARARFARAHTEEPESMAEIFRIERAVLGESPLEPFRRDGAQVIREFEASRHHYQAPRVLVLDYTVTRLFPDGSVLELTHNIVRVQSDEAAEEEAQFSPPEGAQLLTLRTVKADGTRLEPDQISGLEHIELPNVAVGDYIEFEYLRAESPPQAFGGGVVGSRFFFRNYETPFESSSLTLVAPSDMEILVDPRGQAPTTERSVTDGLTVYRWAVHQSEPFSREPSSVSPTEFFPSINWGYHATWNDYVASLRDVLVDREVRDPAVEQLVAEILGGEGRATAEQKAQRLYAWVMDEIEEASGALFEQAATMVAARTGSRSRVLLYLLHIAGIDAELALVRDFSGDSTESQLPEDETYGSLLVRMAGTDGPLWIGTAQRGAQFATLPPNLRGMDALMLNVAAERTHVTTAPLETDLRTVDVEATIDAHANGRFDVSETFRGAGAALWRQQLEGIPAANLESAFNEGYVSRILPGAHMTSLRITGREELDEPLVLHYEFEVEDVGHDTHGRRMLPAIVPTQLSNAFARLASREIEQVISPTLALDVAIRVHLPAGSEVASLPDTEAELGGPHESHALYRAARSDDGFTLERHVRIPRMRVSPTEYRAFAGFCREADELEAQEIGVTLPD